MSGRTRASLVTPRGRGGIATVILHGPRAEAIVGSLFRTIGGRPVGDWPVGRMRYGVIAKSGGQRVDEVIAGRVAGGLLGPEGFEIHCHAGPAATAALLAALADAGAVLCEPEDFPADAATRESPRPRVSASPRQSPDVNAIQCEVLMTLPKAATEKAADLLLAQFDSGLSEAAARWLADPGAARSQIEGAAATWPAARLLTEPPRVVLAGPPNAGKSSLANRLLARPASLVHEMPGTTRDYVAGLGEIGGFAMCVVDTAGLGFGGTDIDRQATQFAHEQIDAADVLLAVFDGAAPLTPTDAELLDMWRPDPRVLAVANKSDLGPPAAWLGRAGGLLATSARTGQGLDELAGRIVRLLGLDRLAPGQPLCFTARQHDLLSAAAGAADSAAAAESLRALLKGG